MEDQSILYSVDNQIAWITINMPKKRNRLNFQAMTALLQSVEKGGKDPGVKVLVVTGAGDKAFCVGADLIEFGQDSLEVIRDGLKVYQEICLVFDRIAKPSIAMINGYAFAGGCGLAMLPTFGIASEKAQFSCPEINVAVWPMMVMGILFRTVGRRKGLELICTGKRIDAKEAERIGMINRVVPHENLRKEVTLFAEKLKEKSRRSLSIGLEAYVTSRDMEYIKAISYLREMAAMIINTADAKEGTRAFTEKRDPNWKE
jgi:enoyl-CoA hydratase